MKLLVLPNMRSCRDAIEYLDHLKINYECRDLLENPLKFNEFIEIFNRSFNDIDSFFQKNGKFSSYLYKKLHLNEIELDEKIRLLIEDPRLMVRPVFIANGQIVLGFDKRKYDRILKN